MNKILKYIFPIVLCIVIGISLFIVLKIKDKIEKESYHVEYIESDNDNEKENSNIINNEVIENTMFQNLVTNSVQTNVVVENKVEENKENVISIYETDSDEGTTDKKQQAINLVKEKWGADDTVTYRCDSVLPSGEYVIAVISKKSAEVKNYFKVNLENKTVMVDY